MTNVKYVHPFAGLDGQSPLEYAAVECLSELAACREAPNSRRQRLQPNITRRAPPRIGA